MQNLDKMRWNKCPKCNLSKIFFKVRNSYLFESEGYVSVKVKNINDNEIFKYRKIVAEQNDTDISNIIPISEEEFKSNTNEDYKKGE